MWILFSSLKLDIKVNGRGKQRYLYRYLLSMCIKFDKFLLIMMIIQAALGNFMPNQFMMKRLIVIEQTVNGSYATAQNKCVHWRDIYRQKM